MLKLSLSEFLGTFFLVFSIFLSVAFAGNMAPLAIGVTLMVAIYALGQVSGGHFNPAVTLAVWFRGKLETEKVAFYIVAQILGGVVAALVALYLAGDISKIKVEGIAPGVDASPTSAMVVELIFTFLLCLTVLMTATSSRTAGNQYFGLAIGFVVVCGAFAGGAISGGAYNPAVALAGHLANISKISGNLGTLFVSYLLPQIVAAFLASLTFKYLIEE